MKHKRDLMEERLLLVLNGEGAGYMPRNENGLQELRLGLTKIADSSYFFRNGDLGPIRN